MHVSDVKTKNLVSKHVIQKEKCKPQTKKLHLQTIKVTKDWYPTCVKNSYELTQNEK